jgi:hypothetical protein
MGGLEGQAEPQWECLSVLCLPIQEPVQHSSAPSREYLGPILLFKIGLGLLVMPVPRPRFVLLRGTIERKTSFSWEFAVVGGCNESQFLLAPAGRTEAVVVTMKVVVVVGYFAASTACFLLKFRQNIPDSP